MRALLRRWQEWRDARDEYRASTEEMVFHVEQETEHNLRNGMPPREARRAALRAFGGIDRFTEAAHDERPGTTWSDFRMSWLDWKLGARMLAKYPGMSRRRRLTAAGRSGSGQSNSSPSRAFSVTSGRAGWIQYCLAATSRTSRSKASTVIICWMRVAAWGPR